MSFKFKRALAFLFDISLAQIVGLLVLSACLFLLGVMNLGVNINLTKYASLIGALSFLVGYVLTNFCSLKKYQASLGKRLLGLNISGTPNVYILLLRTLIPVIASYTFFWLAVASALNYLIGLGHNNKCGHDYICKTTVSNT